MILQMVAEGKITPEEAELLLQAVDEGERTARSAAAETVQSRKAAGLLDDLGETIENVVEQSLQGLEQTLKHLEERFNTKHGDHGLRLRIEEKLRRTAERAVEKAREAEQRAARAAERAAEKAAEHAERLAQKAERRLVRAARFGVSIDRESVQQSESLAITAQPGDRLVLENRVGDVQVSFYDGDEIAVDARKTVWGSDQADAESRAAATRVELVRTGADVVLRADRPAIGGVGFLMLKDTRIDYLIRLPQGTHLDLSNKVGDVELTGATQVGDWKVRVEVGDVEVRVSPAAGFHYDLTVQLGEAAVDLQPGEVTVGKRAVGSVGDGAGSIEAAVKTGEIRVQN